MRRRAAVLFMSALLLFLCGCISDEADLLSLPQPPEHYVLLQKQLDNILKNAEYTTPVNGYNRSSIQFMDVDGDGEDEILSFFKMKNNASSTLQVYLHKRVGDTYVELAKTEGLGDSIDVVYYPKFSHGAKTGIVLGWRLGDNPVCGVSVLLYENGAFKSLYSGEYTGIEVGDLDQDGDDELLLLRNVSGVEAGTAMLMRYESDELITVSTQPLSAGITVPGRIRIASIGQALRAVIVDSQVFTRGYVSDILTFQSGELKNLFYNANAKQSVSTYRSLPLYTCDIDLDGFFEVPLCSLMPGYAQSDTSESFWRTDWCRYDGNGALEKVFSSYFNISDRWYMVLPDKLAKNITVERGMNTETRRSIVFLEWNSVEGIRAEPLWEIYRLSGSDRFEPVENGELTELVRTYDAIYAYKIYDNPSIYRLTSTEIQNCFELLQSEWIYENWAGTQTQNAN